MPLCSASLPPLPFTPKARRRRPARRASFFCTVSPWSRRRPQCSSNTFARLYVRNFRRRWRSTRGCGMTSPAPTTAFTPSSSRARGRVSASCAAGASSTSSSCSGTHESGVRSCGSWAAPRPWWDALQPWRSPPPARSRRTQRPSRGWGVSSCSGSRFAFRRRARVPRPPIGFRTLVRPLSSPQPAEMSRGPR